MPYFVPFYSPPFFLQSGHTNTIFSHFFREAPPLSFKSLPLPTPDNDFIQVEQFKTNKSTRCILLVHGLEGSAKSSYISTLSYVLSSHGWDVAALHLRGCSGTPNMLYRAYNSGSTDDLQTTIDYLLQTYQELALVGFSLGGNIVLKYVGNKGKEISKKIKIAIGISVPCHLSSSCDKLSDFQNFVYNRRFIVSLKNKLRQKMDQFPDKLSIATFQNIKTIRHFDDAYTAPSNGYQSAEDYYTQCSSLYVLDRISIPTLLVNAQDDPFLSPLCFPKEMAETNSYLHFYMPKFGGHVGFWPEQQTRYWKHEEWIIEFLHYFNY